MSFKLYKIYFQNLVIVSFVILGSLLQTNYSVYCKESKIEF